MIDKERLVFWSLTEKKVHTAMCIIMYGYCGRTDLIARPNSVRLLLVGLDGNRSLRMKGGYVR